MEKSLFENLRGVLFTYRWRYFKGLLMVLVSNFLLIANPLVFRNVLNTLEASAQPMDKLFGWVCTLLAIAAISSTFKYWMRVTLISISRDGEVTMRGRLFARIQKQSMAFFDRYGTGELLSRLTSDISTYRDVLGPGIMYPIFSLTLVAPGVSALFYISPQLTAVALLPVFSIPLVNYFVRGKMFTLSLKVQRSLAAVSNVVQEHFSSIRIIKSYVVERGVWQKFARLCELLKDESRRAATLQGALFPFFILLTRAITLLLVLFTELTLYLHWSNLTRADFVSFMWIQSYLFFPVLMLGWLMPVYERGRAAYSRLLEIYEEPIEVKEGTSLLAHIPERASIAFNALNFTYPKGSYPALKQVSFKVEGGTFVGITGPIGAGKTTLFRLLNREYEVPANTLLIDGVDIHSYPLAAFRQQMVTVEQIPFLFSKSIAENVRFGKPHASMEEIVIVSEYADFHETVQGFTSQYETLVGERGVTLSGGQKQRLAMARAFLVNRSILLLDDIFSAIDAGTQKRIFAAMRQNFRGKTVLLITHRASVLEQLDQVVYLAEGRVIEQGPPAALREKGGSYAALVELQTEKSV